MEELRNLYESIDEAYEGATTRHESNNMQEVDFNDTFVILNDVTLDIDEIDYPCDPNGTPSNCAICYCELEVY